MNPTLFTTMNLGCFASVLTTGLMHYVIYGGAILLVAGVVVLWATLIRKKPRERRYQYRRAQPVGVDSTAPTKNTEDVAPSKSERRRRRRSEPRRNPTLAETRGLPPVRDEQSAPTEHYQH